VRRGSAAVVIGGAAIVLAGCAPRLTTLPSGPGVPFPEGVRAAAEATSQCAGVRSLSAEIGLSGRMGDRKVRGRLLAGFSEPGLARLEAPAPFGRPVFTLVMHEDDATLLLNREGRVLAHAAPADIVEALTGVPMDADDLRLALAGCGFDTPEPVDSQAYGDSWVVVGGPRARRWLRRVDGAWRLVASARGPIEIRYDDFTAGRPQRLRLRTTSGGSVLTDLSLRLSQVELNPALGPEVFRLDVPPDAEPLTLEDLRRSGPLGEAGAAGAGRSGP
jgi:hypothetical protein